MTYECLPYADLMLFKEIVGFSFGFYSDSFIELVHPNGNTFFWTKLSDSLNWWCLWDGGEPA